MTDPKKSRWADVPLRNQQSRCGFTAYALGLALIDIPDDLRGTKAEQSAFDRTVKWHRQVCEELAQHGCTVVSPQAFKVRLEKIERLARAVPLSIRWAAKLWAAVVLVWDARITCPAVARTRAWHLLDVSSEAVGRAMIARCPGADEAG